MFESRSLSLVDANFAANDIKIFYKARLKNMLVCRHPIGPTINLWVKTFFDAHSRKTKPFQ